MSKENLRDQEAIDKLKSIINPIIHNIKRASVIATKAEINQIIAAMEKPTKYLFING